MYLCRYTIPKSLRQFRLLATQTAAAFVFNFSRCCYFIFFACLASVVYPWKCFTIILCRPCDLMWNIEHSTLFRAVGNQGYIGAHYVELKLRSETCSSNDLLLVLAPYDFQTFRRLCFTPEKGQKI